MLARVLIPAVLVLGFTLPAAADTIGVLRENTLTLTPADGKITTILIKEGQDLEQVNGSGVWAAGFWRLDPERGFLLDGAWRADALHHHARRGRGWRDLGCRRAHGQGRLESRNRGWAGGP